MWDPCAISTHCSFKSIANIQTKVPGWQRWKVQERTGYPFDPVQETLFMWIHLIHSGDFPALSIRNKSFSCLHIQPNCIWVCFLSQIIKQVCSKKFTSLLGKEPQAMEVIRHSSPDPYHCAEPCHKTHQTLIMCNQFSWARRKTFLVSPVFRQLTLSIYMPKREASSQQTYLFIFCSSQS